MVKCMHTAPAMPIALLPLYAQAAWRCGRQRSGLQPVAQQIGPSCCGRHLPGRLCGGADAVGLLWLCELVWPLGLAPTAEGKSASKLWSCIVVIST